ncbi:MAG: lipopolysaccharide heptosyltransferase II [Chromatiales bacterium]|nr:lipopolysaccharide heptosyltransferase II [Chromatiales bacterium]
MVMAQCLFAALREQAPSTPIDVAAPAWTRALTGRMAEVDAGIDLPFQHGQAALAARWRMGRGLRGRHDRAIVLSNAWKHALMPWAAGIAKRTGYWGEARWPLLNDGRRLDRRRLPRTVDRFLALAHPDGAYDPAIAPDPVARLRADPQGVETALAGLDLLRPVRLLALCPGAEYGPAKRWPATHFADLARHYAARGWSVWLFGSDRDKPISTGIADHIAAHGGIDGDGEVIDLTGRTTLAQAIDLLSLATVTVSNDSGLMHVAAALGRPVVALYGSSDPGHTPPLSAHATVLRLGMECSPCFKRDCPLGHTRCLVDLAPAQVIAAVAAAALED